MTAANALAASQFANVKKFGAKGDNSTDDTAAIQAAISYFASGFATIYFPAGVYKISSTLQIPTTAYYLRFTGDGYGSILLKTASFDLFTWANPGVGNMFLSNTRIDNLTLNSNGITGSNQLINTQYASNVYMERLMLLNLETAGIGIAIQGNGATYSHEVTIKSVYCSTSTGFAGINVSPTASDGFIDDFIMNGNQSGGAGCQYGIYYSNNAGSWATSNVHPYGCSLNSLFVGTPLGTGTNWQFTNCFIDNSTQDNVWMNGTSNSTWTNCQFTYAPSTYSTLKMTNAVNNRFNNCTFISGGSSSTAIQENGSCDGNIFTGCAALGTFSTSPAVVMVGKDSTFRTQGVDSIFTSHVASIAAGATTYVGSGASDTTENNVWIQSPYNGYVKKIIVGSNVAITTGSITATLRIGSAVPASTITAVLNNSNQFQIYGTNGVGIPVTEGQAISVSIVSAALTPTTSINVTLVGAF